MKGSDYLKITPRPLCTAIAAYLETGRGKRSGPAFLTTEAKARERIALRILAGRAQAATILRRTAQ